MAALRKYIWRTLLGLVLFAGLSVAAFALFTGPVLRILIPFASAVIGPDIRVEDVSGNILSGVRFQGLSFESPAAAVTVPSARIDLRAAALLRGRLVFESVEISSPSIALRDVERPAEEEKKKSASKRSAFPVSVESFHLTGGRVILSTSGARVENINADMSFIGGRLQIDRLSARALDSDFTAGGFLDLSPLHADLKLSASGPVSGNARVRGAPEQWSAKLDGDWTAAPPWLGALSAEADVTGSGVQWPDVEAEADWRVQAKTGSTLRGNAFLRDENLRWDARLSGMAVAHTTGTYQIADKILDTEGRLSVSRAEILRITGDKGLNLKAEWRAQGAWPNVDWSVEGSASSATIKGKTIERARLSASGNSQSHKIQFSGSSKQISWTMAGGGTFQSKKWEMTWDQLQWNDGLPWKSTAPFTTVFGPGEFQIQGFEVHTADGQAYASLDARYAEKMWERLLLRVRGLDSRRWADAGLWPFPAQGVFSANADLRGEPPFLTGTADFNLRRLSWENVALGSIEGAGELREKNLRLESVRWESPGGTLTVRGNIPLDFRGNRFPNFNLLFQTSGLSLDFLDPLFPFVAVEGARLEGDLRLTRRISLSAEGDASLAARKISFMDGQMVLNNLDLAVRGEGEVFRIVRGNVNPEKGGSLVLSGAVTSKGPEVHFQARDFKLVLEKQDFTGRVKADLDFQGVWNRLKLSGDAEILFGGLYAYG